MVAKNLKERTDLVRWSSTDRVLGEGMKVALFGKVEFDSYAGQLSMLHPEFEILSGDDEDGEAALHVGRVVPIYEAVSKLTTRILRTLMHRTLESLEPLPDEFPGFFQRVIPIDREKKTAVVAPGVVVRTKRTGRLG